MKLRPNIILNPWVIFGVWLFLWAARLWLIPAYYQRTWELGYYPPNADTIALPIASNAVMAILLAPVFAGALWLLLRRSRVERRTWFAWCRERWILSLGWTLLFCFFSLEVLSGFAEDVRIRLPLNALADIGWFVLWLAVRAVVVSRISPKNGLLTRALRRTVRQGIRTLRMMYQRLTQIFRRSPNTVTAPTHDTQFRFKRPR